MSEAKTTELVTVLAGVMGLTIDPENLPAVAANFELLTRMAALVESAEGEPAELATVFRA